MQAMASAGVTTPSTRMSRGSRRADTRGAAPAAMSRSPPGDLVAFDAGVIVGGYVGELGRTHAVGGDHASIPSSPSAGAISGIGCSTACRPGAPLSDLLAAYDAAGLPAPPMPVARGLGLGFDLPLVTHALPGEAADQQIETGMVLVAHRVRLEGGCRCPLRRGAGRRDRGWPEALSSSSASHWKEHLT